MDVTLSTYEIVAPVISAALIIGYFIAWIIELKRYPHRTLLRGAISVNENWVALIRSDVSKNAILCVQTTRNGISASTFFATIASSIAFVIIPLSGSASSSYQRMQFLVVSGCLFISFINMGLVIRNYKHVTWITCTPADSGDIESQEHTSYKMTEKKIRDLSVFLLKRAALHWNIGIRFFYIAIMAAAWALDPTAVIIVTVVLIVFMFLTDHHI